MAGGGLVTSAKWWHHSPTHIWALSWASGNIARQTIEKAGFGRRSQFRHAQVAVIYLKQIIGVLRRKKTKQRLTFKPCPGVIARRRDIIWASQFDWRASTFILLKKERGKGQFLFPFGYSQFVLQTFYYIDVFIHLYVFLHIFPPQCSLPGDS